ncbi:MAG: lamin tail domain-containing protein [Marinifilaceae bacterium]|jgi:hypothetical protein|nr:lamin tail domain-containing protein [Marinifilaceae bacterium]
MRKIKSIIVFSFIILSLNSLSQQIIFQEGFSTNHEKGYWGNNSDLSNVTYWNIDISSCTLSNDSDYIKIVSTSGGRLEAKDIDGEAIWTTDFIDLSNYKDVNISIYTAETGSSNNSNKYIKLSYIDEYNNEIPFHINPENKGNWANSLALCENLNTDSIKLVVKFNTPLSNDKVYIDNIEISGSPINQNNVSDIEQISDNSITDINLANYDTNSHIELLSFKISDSPFIGNGKPTIINEIYLNNTNTSKSIKLNECISEVLLSSDLYSGIECLFEIIDNRIRIYFNNSYSISDNSSEILSISIRLKNIDKIADNTVLNLNSDWETFYITTDLNGDSIANMQLQSIKYNFRVIADRFYFEQIPGKVNINELFSIKIHAINELQQIDTDYSNNISLKANICPECLIYSNSNNYMSNGVIEFNDIYYSQITDIIIEAFSDDIKLSSQGNISIIGEDDISLSEVGFNINSIKKISSLLNDKNNPISIFRFEIKDIGKSAKNTILRSFRLFSRNINTADLKKTIENIQVKINSIVQTVNAKIEKEYIDLDFNLSPIVIPNSKKDTIDILCNLKKSKLVESNIIALKIDKKHLYWIFDNSGDIPNNEFADDIKGNQFMIDIIGTKLNFKTIPKTTSANSEFKIQIQISDENNNLDLNNNSLCHIEIESGSGSLNSKEGLSKQFINGTCLWSDLSYSNYDNFTISAKDDTGNSAQSKAIWCGDSDSNIQIINSNDRSINSKELDIKDIKIFELKLIDYGSNDKYPTILTKLIFNNYNREFEWNKLINSAFLIDNNNNIVYASKISKDQIIFSSSKSVLQCDNLSENTYSFHINLNQFENIDNFKFKCYIKEDFSEINNHFNSSKLTNVNHNYVSGELRFEINGAKAEILSCPIISNKEYNSVHIFAKIIDELGNIDTDINKNAEIKIYNTDSSFLIPVQIKKGIIDNIIKFSEKNIIKGDYKSTLISDFPCDSSLFSFRNYISHNYENFESDFGIWQNTSAWKLSSFGKINATKSLKHNLINQSGYSYIHKKLGKLNIASGDFYYKFKIKTGDWDCSSNNYWLFNLFSESSNFNISEYKIFIGVNENENDDKIRVWEYKEGQLSILLETNLVWTRDMNTEFVIIYDSQEKTISLYNKNSNSLNKLGSAKVYLSPETSEYYHGLEYYHYSQSNSGKIWLDDIEFTQISNLANLMHYHFDNDKLIITFSDNIKFESISLFNYLNEKLRITAQTNTYKRNFELDILDGINTGYYNLTIHKLEDRHMNINPYLSERIRYNAPINEGDISITEIMANPITSMQLPNHEYIELYNTTEYEIDLNELKLNINNNSFDLHGIINSKSYIIVVDSNAFEYNQNPEYTCVSVAKFYIPNTSAYIKLTSSDFRNIDELNYKSSLHTDSNKKDGAWSLEKINSNISSQNEINWQSSISESGGTPCNLNSISNFDKKAPYLLSSKLISNKTLELQFSEPITILKNKLIKSSFSQNPISLILEEENRSYINFENKLEKSVPYNLKLDSTIRDISNNFLRDTNIIYYLPDTAIFNEIVINEVLFNPHPNGSDFIEIYNRSDKIFDLSNISLAKHNDKFEITDTCNLDFKYLLPYKYTYICTDSANIVDNYFYHDPNAGLEVKKIPSYGDKEGRVILLNDRNIIDEFQYNENMHSPKLKFTEGVSLERINPEVETNNSFNWHSASSSVDYASPGLKNSMYKDINTRNSKIELSAKTFSPNNDGIDDNLVINFTDTQIGDFVNISIYNKRGKLVKTLTENYSISVKDHISWDGTNNNRKLGESGIYVIYIEIINLEKGSTVVKKSCVLGK